MRVCAGALASLACRPRTLDAAAFEVNGRSSPGFLCPVVLPSEAEHDGGVAIVYRRGCDTVVEVVATALPAGRRPREAGADGGLGAGAVPPPPPRLSVRVAPA